MISLVTWKHGFSHAMFMNEKLLFLCDIVNCLMIGQDYELWFELRLEL